MTHEQLERLINSEFNAQELSMLKMLVLTMLKEYDDVNVNESGNIYTMLLNLLDKICYLQRDNKGY
jgi:hypothetical protein